MFFLTWAALFFHVSDYTAVASHGDDFGEKGFCISLSKSQIVSEVGLCVVIPCSFSSASDFTPHSLVWFKCPPSKSRCSDTEIIFHSKNSGKIQERFQGRVGMLEPDVRRRNCSIAIDDLTFSDSGSYQLRVNGLVSSNPEGFTFKRRVSLTVTPLRKPTVLLPKMTAGQAATLTCVAPGLCSTAFIPTIHWAWSRATDNDTRPPAVTDLDLGTAAERYYSTLTFNATAEHHGRGVTCAVSFWRVNVTTEMTVTLNVSYAKLPSILGQTTLKRGDTLSLLCNADSFPPSSITWNVTNVPLGSQLKPSLASAALVIPNVTAAHSGRYECVATNRTVHVDVMVTWFAGIVDGSGCWLRGQLLTCVCISGGVPPPTVTWPSLANRTVCGAVTAVSADNVNSNVTLIGDHLNISAVECVSVHKDGEDRKMLNLRITSEQGDQGKKKLVAMLRLAVFIAFFSGALVSALLCWLARSCCSKAKKSPGRLDLEPLASQVEVLSRQQYHLEEDSKADVAYASINFSAMRRNDTRKVASNHQGTEYAMIKTKEDADQLLQRNDDKEEEGIMVEDGTQCISDKQERDENEEALYSNVG